MQGAKRCQAGRHTVPILHPSIAQLMLHADYEVSHAEMQTIIPRMATGIVSSLRRVPEGVAFLLRDGGIEPGAARSG